MVKNESTVIEKTLQPFLQAGIESYLILDTGSTDNTVEITKNLFKKHKIKDGHVVEQPFVDFSTSRNYAIKQAEILFPQAGFFLMLDAEWYMQNVSNLLEFCKENINASELGFLVSVHTNYYEDKESNRYYYVTRLFKPHKAFHIIIQRLFPVIRNVINTS